MKNACLIANGFLPTRGSWTLDFVSVVMLAVIAAMLFSIYQVRVRRKKTLHRTIQIITALALTAALVLFEIDMRFFTNWRELASSSAYYESGVVGWSLAIHLLFAIPTPFFWAFVIVTALRKFKHGFDRAEFNRWHRISGRVAATLMLTTAITGWVFYYLAFVA